MGRPTLRASLIAPLSFIIVLGVVVESMEIPQSEDRIVLAHRGRVPLQIWQIRTVGQALDQALQMLEPLRPAWAHTSRCFNQLGYVFGWRLNAIAIAKNAYTRNRMGRARDLINNAITKAKECELILVKNRSPARYRLRSGITALKKALSLINAGIAQRQRSNRTESPPRLPLGPRLKPPTPSTIFSAFSLRTGGGSGGNGANPGPGQGPGDYGHALMLSFLYFEAQRAGPLPASNRIRWRGNSGMKDGSDFGVDLTGGYYDAGDNVKFGLPMAYTVTMLAYGVVEFRGGYKGQLGHALEAIKWGTDYLLKTWKPAQQRLYGQVGDGHKDHACWQRPEDCTGATPSYYVDKGKPGTELACETAAALAAAAMTFRPTDPVYAQRCLSAAEQLWNFGVTYRGSYSHTMPQVEAFYPSYSGWDDEILWSTAWLYRATKKASYATFINSMWTFADVNLMSWDNKFSGAAVLLASMSVENGSPFARDLWVPRADSFVCNYLPGGSIRKTPDGLPLVQQWSNLQYVSSALFLGAVHRTTMQKSGMPSLSQCGKSPAVITTFLTRVTQYILGKSPTGMSYMVGFGYKYPQKPHHRAASIPTPSGHHNQNDYSCSGGFKWLHSSSPNPHILYGAIVGGPNGGDSYTDSRENFVMSEPSTYITASFTGVLAALQL